MLVPGGEATRRRIWPAIYPELLRLVREHRSTLVFVTPGARPNASRCGSTTPRPRRPRRRGRAPVEIARAHHGSLAREERAVIEDQLKPATSRVGRHRRWSSASTWGPSTW